MTIMAFITTLLRLQITPRTFVSTKFSSFPVGRRYCDLVTREGHDAATIGIDTAKKSGQQLKNEAVSNADNVSHKTKDIAGKVADTDQDGAGKVKQTAQEAWGSVKDTTQKIKDTVTDNAEVSASTAKNTIKDKAAKVEHCMNTKNLK